MMLFASTGGGRLLVVIAGQRGLCEFRWSVVSQVGRYACSMRFGVRVVTDHLAWARQEVSESAAALW